MLNVSSWNDLVCVSQHVCLSESVWSVTPAELTRFWLFFFPSGSFLWRRGGVLRQLWRGGGGPAGPLGGAGPGPLQVPATLSGGGAEHRLLSAATAPPPGGPPPHCPLRPGQLRTARLLLSVLLRTWGLTAQRRQDGLLTDSLQSSSVSAASVDSSNTIQGLFRTDS